MAGKNARYAGHDQSWKTRFGLEGQKDFEGVQKVGPTVFLERFDLRQWNKTNTPCY